MFEKKPEDLLYIRNCFTFEEKIYDKYMEMRKIMNELENLKYGGDDPFKTSEEFKQGFLAGVKIISSILLDI